MILPDVNVLVHAHNPRSPSHERARGWWQERLAGPLGVGLAWVTIIGFVRITTSPRIFSPPAHVAEALRRVELWLGQPHVHIAQPAQEHFVGFRDALLRLGTGGNLTTDAHLATLAIERGYVLCTTDTDFARFPGLRFENPCAP